MAKNGRPTKFTPETAQKAKELAASGKSNAKIAEILNISDTTLANWQRVNPQFLWALREGQQEANEIIEASLFQKAMGYVHPEEKLFCYEGTITRAETVKHYAPDTEAAKFWLKNRCPEKWREMQTIDSKQELSVTAEVEELLKIFQELGSME